MMRRWLAVLLVVAPELALACPPPMPTSPVPAMAEGATVLGDGGIVFHTGEGNGTSPTVRDAVTGQDIAGEWRSLAPDLLLYQPKAAADRDLEIVADGKVARTVHQLRARGGLATPVIATARSTVKKPKGPPTADVIWGADMTIELKSPLPASAIALIVFDTSGFGGRMWFAPTPGQTKFVGRIATTKPCAMGASPVYAGEKITVGWLDANGRVSPRSRAVPVTLERAPARP